MKHDSGSVTCLFQSNVLMSSKCYLQQLIVSCFMSKIGFLLVNRQKEILQSIIILLRVGIILFLNLKKTWGQGQRTVQCNQHDVRGKPTIKAYLSLIISVDQVDNFLGLRDLSSEDSFSWSTTQISTNCVSTLMVALKKTGHQRRNQ